MASERVNVEPNVDERKNLGNVNVDNNYPLQGLWLPKPPHRAIRL